MPGITAGNPGPVPCIVWWDGRLVVGCGGSVGNCNFVCMEL